VQWEKMSASERKNGAANGECQQLPRAPGQIRAREIERHAGTVPCKNSHAKSIQQQQKKKAPPGVKPRTLQLRTQTLLRWLFEPLVVSRKKCTCNRIY
jgi:hypothetical protein